MRGGGDGIGWHPGSVLGKTQYLAALGRKHG